MVEKKQQTRFSDADLSLVKNTFAENDILLKAIAKVFMQLPLDVVDKDALNVFKNNEQLYYLVSKVFLPKLNDGSPLYAMLDLWMTIDLEGKFITDMKSIAGARKLLINLLEQQLQVLKTYVKDGKADEVILLDSLLEIDGLSSEEIYVNWIARNTLINHTKQQLAQLDILAGQKDETLEQLKERMKKNSNK